jgi:hypothetical protein
MTLPCKNQGARQIHTGLGVKSCIVNYGYYFNCQALLMGAF